MNKLRVLSEANVSGDHLYYNVFIPNSSNFAALSYEPPPTIATFSETRTEALINKPDDYNLAVTRFSIPTNLIPLQICPIVPNQLDPNLTTYEIFLSYNSLVYNASVEYVPTDISLPVPPAPGPSESPIRSNYYRYYSIFSIQHLLDMINTAFNAVYNTLPSGIKATLVYPPFMYYDPTTSLFSLYVPNTYVENNVGIFFNFSLNKLFSGSFNQIIEEKGAGPNFQFVVQSLNGLNQVTVNGTQYYQMTQEFDTISQISSFDALVFTTGSLPIRSEAISSQIIGSNQSTQNTGNYQKILTDFQIDQTTGFEARSFIHYNPSAEYRRVQMYGQVPLNNIDIQVYWRDTSQNLYPVYVSFGNLLTIKILFEKKY